MTPSNDFYREERTFERVMMAFHHLMMDGSDRIRD